MNKTSIAIALAVACMCAARAQTAPSLPSSSQLEQERARIDAERKAMFDAANPATQGKGGKVPSQQAVDREMRRIEPQRKELFDPNNPATKNAPNVFPNVATPERSNVDFEALARRYEQKAQARRTDGLMVFASFTMPKESLKRLITDTSRAGGSVVLRGFKDGSIKSTGLAINDLGEAAGGIQVNPSTG
jgi:conjugal transfer pilus assembly protein TrbC